MHPNKVRFYPALSIEQIKNPYKFFAVPILGGIVKFILLLPAFIAISIIALGVFLAAIINSFVVLFTGKYWQTAYLLNLDFMRFWSKIFFYWTGLTNRHPGFYLKTNEDFLLEIDKPRKPNKLFALPITGGLYRLIILIPYLVYSGILWRGALAGAFFSTFPILFAGRYPESTYEFGKDSMRVNLAQIAYLLGLSDKYPDFYISMNKHQTLKIFLIILGALIFLSRFSPGYRNNYHNYQYKNSHVNVGPKYPLPSVNSL